MMEDKKWWIWGYALLWVAAIVIQGVVVWKMGEGLFDLIATAVLAVLFLVVVNEKIYGKYR